jgi:hypothetical protein
LSEEKMSDPERAARYSDLFDGAHQHGEGSCAYCPFCAAISVARETRPEVVDHLANAAREFLIAAGMLLEDVGSRLGGSEDGGPDRETDQDIPRIRRIDIG